MIVIMICQDMPLSYNNYMLKMATIWVLYLGYYNQYCSYFSLFHNSRFGILQARNDSVVSHMLIIVTHMVLYPVNMSLPGTFFSISFILFYFTIYLSILFFWDIIILYIPFFLRIACKENFGHDTISYSYLFYWLFSSNKHLFTRLKR